MSQDHTRHTTPAPDARTSRGDGEHGKHAYVLFALNMPLSFIAMYFLMFTMVDRFADFFNNLNMGYMALVAPQARQQEVRSE